MAAIEAFFLEEGAPEWSPEGAEGTNQTKGGKALQAEGWPEQRLGSLSVWPSGTPVGGQTQLGRVLEES